MEVIRDTNIGGRIGASLGNALTGLAQVKAQELQNRFKQTQQRAAYQGMDFTPQETAFIQSLPEKNQWEAAQVITQNRPATSRQYEQAGVPEQMSTTEEFLQQAQTQPQQSYGKLSLPQILEQALMQGQRQPAGVNEVLQRLAGQQNPQEQQQRQSAYQQQALNTQRQEYPTQQGQQPRNSFTGYNPAPRGQMPSQQQQMASQFQQPSPQTSSRFGPPKTNVAAQRAIDATNAPYNKAFSAARTNAEEIHEEALSMKRLWETGKVASGFAGSIQGSGVRGTKNLQSNETQLYDKGSKKLAQALASQRGIPTKFKIQYAEEQKPSLDQWHDVQGQLLDDIIGQTGAILQKGRIHDELIAANDYNQPSNLESRVEQYYNASRDQGNNQFSQRQSQENQQRGNQESKQQPPPGESIAGSLGRGAIRTAARAGEAVAGSLGDIAAAGLGIGNYLTGGAIPDYGTVQSYLPLSAPTSDQIKTTLSDITNGYTDPQSGTEEVMDNIVSTVAAIFGPGKAKGFLGKGLSKAGVAPKIAETASKVLLPLSGSTPLKRAIGMGIAGELGAGAAKTLGLGSVGQAATKFAFATAAGIPGTGQALKDLMESNYKAATNLFGNKRINAQDLSKDLLKLKNVAKNRAVPNKEILNEIINEAENTVKSSSSRAGNIKVNDLVQMRKDLNAWYGLAADPGVTGQRHLPKEVRPIVHDLLEEVKKPLAEAAQKYPEAGKALAIGDDIYRGFNDLGKATKFLKENTNLTSLLKNAQTKGALLIGPAYMLGASYGKAGVIAALGAKGISEALQFKNLLSKSNTAYRHYMEALQAAAKGNAAAFAQHAAKLDKEMSEYKKKNE